MQIRKNKTFKEKISKGFENILDHMENVLNYIECIFISEEHSSITNLREYLNERDYTVPDPYQLADMIKSISNSNEENIKNLIKETFKSFERRKKPRLLEEFIRYDSRTGDYLIKWGRIEKMLAEDRDFCYMAGLDYENYGRKDLLKIAGGIALFYKNVENERET